MKLLIYFGRSYAYWMVSFAFRLYWMFDGIWMWNLGEEPGESECIWGCFSPFVGFREICERSVSYICYWKCEILNSPIDGKRLNILGNDPRMSEPCWFSTWISHWTWATSTHFHKNRCNFSTFRRRQQGPEPLITRLTHTSPNASNRDRMSRDWRQPHIDAINWYTTRREPDFTHTLMIMSLTIDMS